MSFTTLLPGQLYKEENEAKLPKLAEIVGTNQNRPICFEGLKHNNLATSAKFCNHSTKLIALIPTPNDNSKLQNCTR